MKTRIAAAVAVLTLTVTLAACGSGNPGSAATSATAGAAQPETAAGARAAATSYFALYAAGQFAATWPLLTPAARHAIPRAVWVTVHERCRSATVSLAYEVKHVTMAGSTAVVTVSLAGALSKLAAESQAFVYSAGRWGYSPPDMSLYGHGSVAADVAAARAKGMCSG